MYNVQDWYWAVSGVDNEVYSSAAGRYVPLDNLAYVAWLQQGKTPTQISSDYELRQVFADQYPAGWPSLVIVAQAQSLLDKSDVTILRCFEAGVMPPPAWTAYRATLRDIVKTGTGAIPAMPPYPSGT